MLFFVYQVSEAGSVCLLSLLKKVCSLSPVKHAFQKICAEHLNKPRTKRAPHKRAVAEYALLGGGRFSRLSGERSGGKSKKRKEDTMMNQ